MPTAVTLIVGLCFSACIHAFGKKCWMNSTVKLKGRVLTMEHWNCKWLILELHLCWTSPTKYYQQRLKESWGVQIKAWWFVVTDGLGSTVRLRFTKSISGLHFQNTRKFAIHLVFLFFCFFPVHLSKYSLEPSPHLKQGGKCLIYTGTNIACLIRDVFFLVWNKNYEHAINTIISPYWEKCFFLWPHPSFLSQFDFVLKWLI